jgi:hypothetical protein
MVPPPPAPAEGEADLGEDLTTLEDIEKAPRDYLYELSDPHNPEIKVRFLVTPKAVNCARLMKEQGIPVFCVQEMACLFAGSHRLIERGLGGITPSDFKRYAEARLAGAPLKLKPVVFFTEEERQPCASPSTSSDDARPLEQPASTSTRTSPKPPAEDASETPA